jgi:hypothetical protein
VIDRADQQVKHWLEEVAGKPPVWLAPGLKPPDGGAVGMYLAGFADSVAPRGARDTPPQVRLRYLVTTWDASPEDEHRVLGKLLFAALALGDWEVDLSPPAPVLWQALGLAPRPAFTLVVPLRSERVAPRAPLVTTEPRFRTVPASTLRGRLVVAGMPLAAARVELPSLGSATETDEEGNFSFGLVPNEAGKHHLRVVARGDVQNFTVEAGPPGSGPVTITFRPPEG